MNVHMRVRELKTVSFKSILHVIHNVKIYRPVILVLTPRAGSVRNVAVSEFLDVNHGL